MCDWGEHEPDDEGTFEDFRDICGWGDDDDD